MSESSPEIARLVDWLTHYATCFIDDERVGRRMLEIVEVLRAPAQCVPIGSPLGDGSELSEAARYLADSTERYCRSYEQRGADDMQTGRAWDAMRQGRDWVRKALSVTSTDGGGA